jgi:hypothetical protein
MTLPEEFDIDFYKNHHPDLKEAFGDNKDLLIDHYRKNGKFEHRQYTELPDNWDWEHYVEKFPTEIFTKEEAIAHYSQHKKYTLRAESKIKEKEPIFIVYFICINPEKHWQDFVAGQILDILRSKILCSAKLFVLICGTESQIQEAQYIITSLVKNHVEFTSVYKNEYEYPAIQKIQELATQFPDKIFIYLHSKGMFFNHPHPWRSIMNKKLTMNLFLDWDNTLHIFNKCTNIQKAGLFPAIGGWIWFNFWWARGSYIAKCKPLEKSDDRFLCEWWLGTHGSRTWTDCYSLYYKNISYHRVSNTMPGIIYKELDPPDQIPLVY